MNKQHILILGHSRLQREMLRDVLVKEGHTVSESENEERGIEILQATHVDLILMDRMMPDIGAITVLKKIKKINPEIDVIITITPTDLEAGVQAMNGGAFAYVIQPVHGQELLIMVERAAERRILIRENEMMRKELKEKGVTSDRIIYRSTKMRHIIDMARRIADSQMTVLLQGESGTGKELLARLIHNLSNRANNPIIVVNCGALPEVLLERELFGYEKGAFTGAVSQWIGRIQEANDGTLLIDDIGEISSPAQLKILRFLKEGEFQRFGNNQLLRADVSIISSTRRTLETLVNQGSFNRDLFYRLNVVTMSLPPLRERKEDLPALIDHFLNLHAHANNKDIVGVTREAQEMLFKYDYPGNVRELENILERAVVIARDPLISIEDLPFREADEHRMTEMKTEVGILRQSIEELERRMILEAMSRSADHQTKAADILGISERMLRYKLRKYGIKE